MDKKKQMLFNINNFLLALTDILDTRECETKGLNSSHSLRVAYISLNVAVKLEYTPKELFDLCAYSLFHNYIDEQKAKLLQIDNTQNKLSDIVELVHKIEVQYDFSKKEIQNRYLIKTALNSLNVNQKQIEITNILIELFEDMEFWLDCQSSHMMQQYIYMNLHDFTTPLDFEKVLEITSMFGSLQEDVSKLLEYGAIMCDYYGFEHKDKYTFLIAASLMNLGKLAISEKIIQKQGKLTDDEYEIVKSNVYYIKNALRNIYSFDDIANWASRHHEKLDGSGYPSGLCANSLSLKDRLISVLNIYNSLLYKKSYREMFSQFQTIKIIHKMAQNLEIDKAISEDFEKVFEN